LSGRLADEKHLAPACNWTITRMARMSIPYPRHYVRELLTLDTI